MVRVNKLEWWDVQLMLQEKDRKGNKVERRVLVNQSGELHQGQLLAIMGPSGCGKTSLLSVISGRVAYNSNFTLTGNVYFNGVPINRARFDKKIAVVAQDDTLFAYLTVRETLFLAAYFAYGEIQGRATTDAIVDAVMKELNLTTASETLVGSSTQRGVSGGEYRRVLIGKELMKKPRTIFLDEPTSGLDAFQAFAVIESMKTLAARNKIVVSVIHQPRSSIFALFDLLLLLSAGRLMYFGKASQAVAYFSAMGYPCPAHFNPADFFLDLLSVNAKSSALETESRTRIDALARGWADPLNTAKTVAMAGHTRVVEESKHGEEAEVQSEDEDEIIGHALKGQRCRSGSHRGDEPGAITAAVAGELPYASGRSEGDSTGSDGSGMYSPFRAVRHWFTAFGLLLWRALIEIFRNYGGITIRACTVLFYAMILSLIYQNIGYGQQSIQDRTGLLYFMLINQSFTPLFVLLDVFPSEKVIVSREILSGAYPTSAYFVSRVMAELPGQCILTVTYSTIVYWSAGLNPLPERFGLYLVTVLLTTFCSMGLGFMVSACSPSKIIANAIGPPMLIILLLFGGFYINTSSLPPGSEWVRYLSMVYWGFQALVINEFHGERFYCDNGVTAEPTITASIAASATLRRRLTAEIGRWAHSGAEASGGSVACVPSGDEQIAMLSFQNGSVAQSLGFLAVLFVGFLSIAYVTLLFNRERYQKILPPEDGGDNEGLGGIEETTTAQVNAGGTSVPAVVGAGTGDDSGGRPEGVKRHRSRGEQDSGNFASAWHLSAS